MIRERTLRIVLVLVGLIFVAGVYPLITSVREGWQANKEDAEPMGLSLYVMMGVFLLVAARNPAANRGVIVFAGWLNIAHAAVMTVMAVHLPNEREDMLIASAIFAGIGAILILLPPAQQLSERAVSNP
jgi:quinol-cytochrome oxidoreductase complex cytochrome b subunit